LTRTQNISTAVAIEDRISYEIRLQRYRISLLKHLWHLNEDKIEGFIIDKDI